MTKKIYSFSLMTAIMLLFSVVANASINVTASPADGSKVESLSEVILTFNDKQEADNGSNSGNITVKYGEATIGATSGYGDEANQMKITFSEITAEGKVTISFPEGAFSLDGNASEAFELSYTISKASAITLTPAAGSTVGWLSRIVYSDPELTGYFSGVYGADQGKVVAADGTEYALSVTYDYSLGGGKAAFDLKSAITTPGTYTVIIPQGAASVYGQLADGSWGNVYNKPVEATYTVTGEGLTKVESTPANGESVKKFQTLTLKFPDYETVAPKSAYTSVYVYNKETGNSAGSFTLSNFVATGNSATASLWNAIIEPGDYTVDFPEGAFLLGDSQEPCSPFGMTFTVIKPESILITLTPNEENAVDFVDQFIVNFPNEAASSINTSASFTVNKVNEDGTVKQVAGAYYRGSNMTAVEGTSSYKILINDVIVEAGKYQVIIPINTFTFSDDRFNQADTLYFTVSGKMKSPKMVITPEAGSTLAKIKEFIVEFPEYESVELNMQTTRNSITLYNGRPTYVNGYISASTFSTASRDNIKRVEGKNNAFIIPLNGTAINKGEYTLAFPTGLFKMGNGECYNTTDSLTYYCDGSGLDKLAVTPAAPVKALKDITITWIEEESISFQNSWPGATLYKVNNEQTWDDYKEYVGSAGLSIEGNKLSVSLSKEYTEEGEYYVDITSYLLFMTDGTTACTPQKVYFTIDPNATETGINTVNAAKGNQTVYNLAGQRVNANVKGIVVKNGKKFINK